jgi:hypothetical protein
MESLVPNPGLAVFRRRMSFSLVILDFVILCVIG